MFIYSVQILLFEWLGMSGSGWLVVGWHAPSPPTHDLSTVNCLLPGFQMSACSESYGD